MSSRPASVRCWPRWRPGRSNGAIADSLFLTKRAVEKHINAIFLKLGLREYEDTSRRVTAALIYLADPGSHASPTES